MKNILIKGLFVSVSILFITSSSSALTCTNLTKPLANGSKDSEVLKLQQFLFDGGYLSTKPNGYFGAGTLTALKKFQKANGLAQVGSVGPGTRSKIKEVSCNDSVSNNILSKKMVGIVNQSESNIIKNNVSTTTSNKYYTEKCPIITRELAKKIRSTEVDEQVIKLQDFLREQNTYIKSPSGIFDEYTYRAVAEWQELAGLNGKIKQLGVVDLKTIEEMNKLCVVGKSTFPESGDVFFTPNKVPTIPLPNGWKVTVLLDNKISNSTQKSGLQTKVTFVDENNSHHRGLTYELYLNGGSTGNDIAKAELPIIENLSQKAKDNGWEFISKKVVPDYSAPITEVFYEGNSDLTGPDSIFQTRIISFTGYTYVLTGVSSKKYMSNQNIHAWYESIFQNLYVPSFSKTAEMGIPMYKDVGARIDAFRSEPKGIAKDFYVDKCPVITQDLFYGDTDKDTDGQVALIQNMLVNLYKMYPLLWLGEDNRIFDSLTEMLVIKFQREMGLEGSGGIGVKTREVIKNYCKIKNNSTQSSSTVGLVSTSTTLIQKNLTSEPSLKITTPNGGQSIKIGSNYRIFWETQLIPKNAQLDAEVFEITGDTIVFNKSGGCSNCVGGGLRSGLSAVFPVNEGPGSTEWKSAGVTYSGTKLKAGNHYVIKAVVSKTGTYEKGECPKSYSVCTIDIATDWSDGVFTLVN
ncbi:MAG: peptidoglycan-binding domain-containing protein [Candidatus Nomurabacteria bacterium]